MLVAVSAVVVHRSSCSSSVTTSCVCEQIERKETNECVCLCLFRIEKEKNDSFFQKLFVSKLKNEKTDSESNLKSENRKEREVQESINKTQKESIGQSANEQCEQEKGVLLLRP